MLTFPKKCDTIKLEKAILILYKGGIKMDVNTFIQIINGVGFPIAACIGMAVFIVWNIKNTREDREENRKIQDETLSSLKESVDNNTATINKLIQQLEGLKNV